MKLDASDLRLTLSPDVLELGSLLAASALEPLMQVQPEGQSLYLCCTALLGILGKRCPVVFACLFGSSTANLLPSHTSTVAASA